MIPVCKIHKELGRNFKAFTTHMGDKWFGALWSCDLRHCDEVAVGTIQPLSSREYLAR